MSRLLIPDDPVHYLPKLARRIGLAESILAQQIYYFQTSGGSGVEHDGHRWIFNTYEQWAEKTGLSVKQVRTAVGRLEKLGVLVSAQLRKHKFDHKKFYRIVETHELFALPACPGGQPDLPVGADPEAPGGRSSLYPENITEINTENDAAPAGAPPSSEQFLPLADDCRKVIEEGCQQLEIGGRLPAYTQQAAADTIDKLIRLDHVPKDEVLPALKWAFSGEPSFEWHLQLMSIAQWRKKGKRNDTAKFVTMWRQWREAQRAPPGNSRNQHATSFEIGRIMD